MHMNEKQVGNVSRDIKNEERERGFIEKIETRDESDGSCAIALLSLPPSAPKRDAIFFFSGWRVINPFLCYFRK